MQPLPRAILLRFKRYGLANPHPIRQRLSTARWRLEGEQVQSVVERVLEELRRWRVFVQFGMTASALPEMRRRALASHLLTCRLSTLTPKTWRASVT